MTSCIQKRATSHKQVTTKQIDHTWVQGHLRHNIISVNLVSSLRKAIRKCSPFYGTGRLITPFTKVCHWILAMIQKNSVQPHTFFFHANFNFVIRSTLSQTRQSSAVGIAIRLRAGRPGGSSPDRGNKLPSTPKFPDRV